jgi:signal transduction histidine kinase/DNA-binding response OmpR family regulator
MLSTTLVKTNGIDPLSRAARITDILVVDDLPEKLLVYRTVLEDPELNIVTARSGQEALKAVLQGEFAVILLDVSMPGMDGFETAKLIHQRKRSSATPIIFLTAFTDDMRMAQGYASGAVDYIPTPVVPEILRAKVQVFVELFQMRRISAQQAEERVKRESAEEAVQRSAFLAEAGASITRSLDLSSLIDALARAPVPFLADVCVLAMNDDHGHTNDVKCVWRPDAEHGDAVTTNGTAYPFPWLGKALQRAMDIDQPQLLDAIPPGRSGNQNNVPDINGGHALILPISSRRGMRGALALLRRRGSHPYRPDEVSLSRELASRACIALENVLLVQGIQEADRRKDEFLGMLAHELRNPLAPLRNSVDILGMVDVQDPTLDQARAVIDRQVTHMTRLVDDLLDATRIARGKVLLRKEPCDINAIIRQTTTDYRSIFDTAGIQFTVELHEKPLPIYGDPTRLAQAVGNLLHNAHKFTGAGGKVSLRVQHDKEDGWVHITVRDTGMGIDTSVLPHIFEVFRQADQGLDRHRGGLGLGLTLVKGLVELHGGTVEVAATKPGKGTTFLLRLPLEKELPTRQSTARPSIPNERKHRILVIDDNRDAAEILQLILRRDGHETAIACTGPEGLESMVRFRPNVVICDIGLPGTDGYQIARIIRSKPDGKKIHLIALTGYGREEDQARSHEAGFERHMTKPIDIVALRNVLEEVVQPVAG